MDEDIINARLPGIYKGMLGDTRTEAALTPERLSYLKASMGLNYGNETAGPELWGAAPRSDYVDYHTLPEAVGMFASERLERALGPVVRSGATEEGGNVYEGGFTNPYRFGETSFDQNPKRFIDKSDPNYQESIFAEPSELPVMDTGGLGGVFKKLAGREVLLAKRQGLIDKVKGIKGDYDRMIAESAKITGVVPEGLISKVADKFKSAYAAAREVAGGGSWVDIAVLRDNLGLSQEKMAGLLRRAAREGHVVLEKGERSVVSDYLKGGMVDNKLLVRLDPEFFDNIGSYIKSGAKEAVSVVPKAVEDNVFKAYNVLRSKEGYSSLPIAQIRDMAGVSQAEIEAIIRKLAEEGKVSLSRGDWSLSSEHVRSGVIPMGKDPAGGAYKYTLVKFK